MTDDQAQLAWAATGLATKNFSLKHMKERFFDTCGDNVA